MSSRNQNNYLDSKTIIYTSTKGSYKPHCLIFQPSHGRKKPTTLCLEVKKTLHPWVYLSNQLLEELYFLPKQQEISVFWPVLQPGTDNPLFLILHKLDSAEHGVTANTSCGKKDLNPMQPQHTRPSKRLAHKSVFKTCTFQRYQRCLQTLCI